jgi:LacI family transcriptional regulator
MVSALETGGITVIVTGFKIDYETRKKHGTYSTQSGGVKRRGKDITIRTVAEHAGVSIATISRYFNTPDTVTFENKERIKHAVEALGFVPDPVARALGNCKVENIAVLVPNISNPIMAEITRGIIEELEKNQITVLLYDCHESEERERRFMATLHTKMISGVILVSDCGSAGRFESIKQILPVVLVDCPEELADIDSIRIDERQGMLRLVTCLADFGHRRIGLLAGDRATMSGIQRVVAFKEAIKLDGRNDGFERVLFCPWSLRGGYEGLKGLLARDDPPTAVICGNDVIAFGALGAAHAIGLAIPKDISIAGFDNSPNGEFSIPPLTTLKYPGVSMGKKAAQLILRRMEDSDDEPRGERYSRALALDLILRDSTGPAQR